MPNPYIDKVVATLGPLFQNNNINLRWNTPEEAKQCIAIIRLKQKEIKLVKGEITAAKKQIHSQYTDKKTNVGKGFGAAVATGVFGAKAVGRSNSVARNNIRNQEMKVMQPYVDAERFIADLLVKLDNVKLQLDLWISQHK